MKARPGGAMTSYNRLAFAMAKDLRPHGIASVALRPGFVKPGWQSCASGLGEQSFERR
jgi:NAD(P)-dependent dehydrogenase (short-subunit alcohol dehydrogenase family)